MCLSPYPGKSNAPISLSNRKCWSIFPQLYIMWQQEWPCFLASGLVDCTGLQYKSILTNCVIQQFYSSLEYCWACKKQIQELLLGVSNNRVCIYFFVFERPFLISDFGDLCIYWYFIYILLFFSVITKCSLERLLSSILSHNNVFLLNYSIILNCSKYLYVYCLGDSDWKVA